MSATSLRLRQPRFADDMWYSSDSAQLQQDVQGYLAHAPAHPIGLLGLVAPHAGYFFSGHVAGATFAGLPPGAFETVILVGPDHRGAAPGAVSTLQVDAWRTPLGDIPVNWGLLQAVQAEFNLALLSSDEEHCLEVELPFLQMTLQQFQLVPLMMSDQSLETCRRLGKALVNAVRSQSNGDILLVASSDLSHYFDDEVARRLDQTTLELILKLDADGLVRHVEEGRRQGRPFACGAGPIAVIIHGATALGATQATLLKYATSADAHPRKDRVVGYAAVAISKEAQ
ncbi:MAG: AmmeMemoRadiSam system protein B [Chloroflexi bacterium]|nr:AmmeMemoRadiSam system protein B [Chloroflexota bacterium]